MVYVYMNDIHKAEKDIKASNWLGLKKNKILIILYIIYHTL